MVKIIKLGNNVDTDVIAPGPYLHLSLEKQVPHCLESIYPNFFNIARKGDVVIAGENFGTGSSREQAPALLKLIGIDLIIAKDFSRLFFRNAVNVGIIPCTWIDDFQIEDGEEVEVLWEKSEIMNENISFRFRKPQGIPMDIIREGGMVEYAKKMLSGEITPEK